MGIQYRDEERVDYASLIRLLTRFWTDSKYRKNYSNQINNLVKMLKPFFPQDPRVHVVLEMMVVEGDPQAIQSLTRQELGICFREEVIKKFFKEKFILLWAESLAHGGAMLRFAARVAGDEVFHTAKKLALHPEIEDLRMHEIWKGDQNFVSYCSVI